MYHRISVLVPVLVRVPEYLSTSMSTSTSTITLELMSMSTRNSVLEYRVRALMIEDFLDPDIRVIKGPYYTYCLVSNIRPTLVAN